MIPRLALVVAIVFGAVTQARAADHRVLWLHHVHTGEEIRVRPFRSFGRMRLSPWRRLNRFLRSTRTGEARAISPRLLRTLAHLQRHFGGRRVRVFSGYRVADSPDAPTSYHHVARAVDVSIDGVSNREAFEACRQLARAGCGLYPAGHHVHIDARASPAIWVDLSRSGESAIYVKHPDAWLRAHPSAAR